MPENRQALNVPPLTRGANQLLSRCRCWTTPLGPLRPSHRRPPAPAGAAIAPPPNSSASKQLGGATSAASAAPMPAGDEDRPGIGTSLEQPAVPEIAQTEPRSGSEPAPPQLQAGPSPGPDSRRGAELPPAAVIAARRPSRRPRPEAPPNCSPRTRRSGCWSATRPAALRPGRRRPGSCACCAAAGSRRATRHPHTRVRGNAGITYFFAEDRDGARRVEHDLDEGFGPARLSPAARGAPLPRPGTIEVLVPAR